MRPSRRIAVGDALIAALAATGSRWGSALGRGDAGGALRSRPVRGHGRGRRDAAAAVHPRALHPAGSLPDGLREPARLRGCSDRRAALHDGPPWCAREAAACDCASVTLHVGLDTFRPLEGDFVDEHRIHREWYEIPSRTRGAARRATRRRTGGRRWHDQRPGARDGRARRAAARGWTDLYITPPHRVPRRSTR